MKFIRDASENEVLAVCPIESNIQATALAAAPYSVWCFTAQDIAAVTGRLPDTTYDATLEDLRPAWKEHCQQDAYAMARHHRALRFLVAGGAFPHRPVLYRPPAMEQFSCYIHDGKHRLFAALDYAVGHPDFTVEVFWSDRGSGRVCAPKFAG